MHPSVQKAKDALLRSFEFMKTTVFPWIAQVAYPALLAALSFLGSLWTRFILPLFQLKAIRSIRLKVQIWQFALLTATISFLLIGFFVYEKKLHYINLDFELAEPIPDINEFLKPIKQTRGGGNSQQRQVHLSDGFELPSEKDFAPALQIDAKLEEKSFYAVIWNKKRELVYKTKNAPDFGEFIEQEEDQTGLWYRWAGGNREAIRFTSGEGWTLIGVPKSIVEAQLSSFKWTLIIVGFGVSLIAFSGGWLISGQAIRPIESISETAKQIAEGNLNNRISTSDTDSELGQLAQVLNNTFNRLEVALNRQIQFTADASHELRTPLSIVLNECHWALKQQRDPTDYAASFETCAQTAKHMSGLIESLLQLARIDSGEARLKIQDEQIDSLISDTIALLTPIANQKDIRLTAHLQPVVSTVDRDKIRQILINLISNAIQHSPAGTEISIHLNYSQNNLTIDVADQGTGITSNEIPYLFDRFYRSDKARSHDGGSGLGLAISKAIAVVHQGDLSVSSQEGKGSVFRLTLPIKMSKEV